MTLSVSGRSGRDDTPDKIAAAVLAARIWDAVHSSVMFMNEYTKNMLRTLAASGGNSIAPHVGGDSAVEQTGVAAPD